MGIAIDKWLNGELDKEEIQESYENLQETLNDVNDELMPPTHEFLYCEQKEE